MALRVFAYYNTTPPRNNRSDGVLPKVEAVMFAVISFAPVRSSFSAVAIGILLLCASHFGLVGMRYLERNT
jgi:hypothetical protein